MTRQSLRASLSLLALLLFSAPALAGRRDAGPSLRYLRQAFVPQGWTDAEIAFQAALLDSAGTWVDSAACGGPCFHPLVSAEWRPYSTGSWDWSPAGRTWMADEPWGWITHNFGSWTLDASGWFWCPWGDVAVGLTAVAVGSYDLDCWCGYGWYDDTAWYPPSVPPQGGRWEPTEPKPPRGPLVTEPVGPRGERRTRIVEARLARARAATGTPRPGAERPAAVRVTATGVRSASGGGSSSGSSSWGRFEPSSSSSSSGSSGSSGPSFSPAPPRSDPPSSPAPAPAPVNVNAPDRRG